MAEIELRNYLEYTPSITKMDIVKTEHDIISHCIDGVNRMMEEGVKVDTECFVRYIDGVRTMAERLMDILDEQEKLHNNLGFPPEDMINR